eukprot:m.145630 g.145630  ORF g.145630 m.145630 type:complete len:136 (-) comp10080_c0_seq2:2152-2559(-)
MMLLLSGKLTAKFNDHPKPQYQSVSAFSPICNPTECDWGKKAFRGYLGDDESAWKEWDPSLLLKERVAAGNVPRLLVSQGTADQFLEQNQLRTQTLPQHGNINVRMEDGYDHSYYFIATFIEEHIAHHAAELGCQ